MKRYFERNKAHLSEKSRLYLEINRDKRLEQRKVYRKANKERIAEAKKLDYEKNKLARLSKRKEWYRNNKEKHRKRGVEWQQRNLESVRKYKNKYHKSQYETDIQARLKIVCRNRLRSALKARFCNSTKVGSAVSDLGCTIDQLVAHLESQFISGMTWQNHGSGKGKWQIDHIKPLSSFDLSVRDEFLIACNYANLRPLWFEEHAIKSAKERHAPQKL